MSLFRDPVQHVANPPSTWTVVKSGRRWQLCAAGATVGTFGRKVDAEDAKISGFWVTLYAQESRWYAGEPVTGWRPYGPPAVIRGEATVDVRDGHLLITVPGAEDKHELEIGGKPIPLEIELGAWRDDEDGMDRAAAGLERIGWRNVGEWQARTDHVHVRSVELSMAARAQQS